VQSIFRSTVFSSALAAAALAQTNISDGRITQDVGRRPTYCATASAWAIPATPTDMFTITGSASKTIRVLSLWMSPTQTTAAIGVFQVVKRSTADTSGASVASTIVPLDSTFAAATAVSKHWTANPTLGTGVGNVVIIRAPIPAPATFATSPGWPLFIDFTQGGLLPGVVLRGAAQELSLNFNGVALPAGLSITATWCWIEE
jgi:hypothetical protein